MTVADVFKIVGLGAVTIIIMAVAITRAVTGKWQSVTQPSMSNLRMVECYSCGKRWMTEAEQPTCPDCEGENVVDVLMEMEREL